MRRRLISRLETPSAKCLDIPLGSVLGTHDYLNRDFRTALLGLAFERECCNGCFLVYIHVNRSLVIEYAVCPRQMARHSDPPLDSY
jgi:hypothetical protein